jgi:imidazolonepropionase-like amidohydrolase
LAIAVRSNERLKNGNPWRPGSLDDHRAIELLVDAGYTPVEAIRIGTLNGAA